MDSLIHQPMENTPQLETLTLLMTIECLKTLNSKNVAIFQRLSKNCSLQGHGLLIHRISEISLHNDLLTLIFDDNYFEFKPLSDFFLECPTNIIPRPQDYFQVDMSDFLDREFGPTTESSKLQAIHSSLDLIQAYLLDLENMVFLVQRVSNQYLEMLGLKLTEFEPQTIIPLSKRSPNSKFEFAIKCHEALLVEFNDIASVLKFLYSFPCDNIVESIYSIEYQYIDQNVNEVTTISGNLKSIRLEEMRDCRNGFKSGTIKPLFAIWEAPKEGKYVVEAWAAKGVKVEGTFTFKAGQLLSVRPHTTLTRATVSMVRLLDINRMDLTYYEGRIISCSADSKDERLQSLNVGTHQKFGTQENYGPGRVSITFID